MPSISEALEAKLELAEWWQTAHGYKYGQGFAESMHGRDPLGKFHDNDAVRWWSKNLPRIHQSVLATSETYYVDQDTQDVITAVASDIPSAKFDRTTVPSDAGYIYLHHPMYFKDVNDKLVNVRAIVWAKAGRSEGYQDIKPLAIDEMPYGLWVAMYSDRDDPADEIYQSWSAEDRAFFQHATPRLALAHYSPWPFDKGFPNEGIGTTLRWIAAFWAFIRQKLFKLSRERAPRAQARRVERELQGIPETIVVHLRETLYQHAERSEEPGFVDWSHRWIVRGHWHMYRTNQGLNLDTCFRM